MPNALAQMFLNPISNQSVQCLECKANGIHYMMYVQTKAHLKMHHNMTKEEYLNKYPQQKDSAYWGTPYKALHKMLNGRARPGKG